MAATVVKYRFNCHHSRAGRSYSPSSDSFCAAIRLCPIMTIGKTQKALILTAKHAQWQLGESPIPVPGPKDVLVRIVATALNPIDWKVKTAFSRLISSYPHVGGVDGAGIVDEVGWEVTTVMKGDKIVFQGWVENTKATFQQYCIVPVEITAKIPDNISFDQAASIPLGLSTVATGLYGHHPMSRSLRFPAPWEEDGTTRFAGKAVFILGGASSVGQFAIQMMNMSKFSPIITTASLHNEPLLRSLGATHVIDRSLSPTQIKLELAKLMGGRPVEFVYDAISLPDTQAFAYDLVAPGGILVVVLPDVIPKELKEADKGKEVLQVVGNVHQPENRQIGVELYARLTEWLQTGKLVVCFSPDADNVVEDGGADGVVLIQPNKVEVLPNGLAGIPGGLERLENGQVSGIKLIARPQETL
ncbi:GroES-like protein [Cubamyces sp. BRFM 1775]|nr:GroES-like protein [Cubamyces sp. BRFM 1775]